MSRLSLFGFQWALGDSLVCSQPLRPLSRALATQTAHPKLRIPSYHCDRDRRRSLKGALTARHRTSSRKKRGPITLGHPAILPLPACPSSFPTSSYFNASRLCQWAAGPVHLCRLNSTALLWDRKLPCALDSRHTCRPRLSPKACTAPVCA